MTGKTHIKVQHFQVPFNFLSPASSTSLVSMILYLSAVVNLFLEGAGGGEGEGRAENYN